MSIRARTLGPSGSRDALLDDNVKMVDAAGIEPATPSMSTRCSPAELRVRLGKGGTYRQDGQRLQAICSHSSSAAVQPASTRKASMMW